MKSALFVALMISASIGCCGASPNLIFVYKDGIQGQGTISKGREQMGLIELLPVKASDNQIRDLWVDLSPSNRVVFADITEKQIQSLSSFSYTSKSNEAPHRLYYVSGYSFEFDSDKLVKFQANRYGFPPKEGTAFVHLGSLSRQASLSLPCSLDEFEKVFGKADRVSKGFGW